jgi:hypothetical protein
MRKKLEIFDVCILTHKQSKWLVGNNLYNGQVCTLRRSHQKGKENNKGEGYNIVDVTTRHMRQSNVHTSSLGKKKGPKEHPSESGTYI